MDLNELIAEQGRRLWLTAHAGLHSSAEAEAFMREVSVALRYGAANNLPLASMYRATQRQVPVLEDEKAAHARAFELTNTLLASGSVVEINLIANRLALAHERVMPAMYALRRGNRKPQLSGAASQALEFVTGNETATSGEIRRLLNVDGQPRPDAADLALGELQRELLVDRGPSQGPGTGVFYLTREGYPYRPLAAAHPGIVSAAATLSRTEAALSLLSAYLAAAGFAVRRQLATLFQLLLDAGEVDSAIQKLRDDGVVQELQVAKKHLVLYQADESRRSIAASKEPER